MGKAVWSAPARYVVNGAMVTPGIDMVTPGIDMVMPQIELREKGTEGGTIICFLWEAVCELGLKGAIHLL